jgi:hypothetical protein
MGGQKTIGRGPFPTEETTTEMKECPVPERKANYRRHASIATKIGIAGNDTSLILIMLGMMVTGSPAQKRDLIGKVRDISNMAE